MYTIQHYVIKFVSDFATGFYIVESCEKYSNGCGLSMIWDTHTLNNSDWLISYTVVLNKNLKTNFCNCGRHKLETHQKLLWFVRNRQMLKANAHRL